jgi:hypothetical protein
MILTWSIWLLESYLSTGENESQEKTTLVATDRRIGHRGYPLLSSATVTEVCERLMMVEISLRELVGVAGDAISYVLIWRTRCSSAASRSNMGSKVI